MKTIIGICGDCFAACCTTFSNVHHGFNHFLAILDTRRARILCFSMARSFTLLLLEKKLLCNCPCPVLSSLPMTVFPALAAVSVNWMFQMNQLRKRIQGHRRHQGLEEHLCEGAWSPVTLTGSTVESTRAARTGHRNGLTSGSQDI